MQQIAIRWFVFSLIGFGFSTLINLALPPNGDTYASSSKRYFIGADVYIASEIAAMREGRLSQLSGNIRPNNPIEFADLVMLKGRLTESQGLGAIQYYVVPRLHPGLDTVIPSLCILGIGVLLYVIIYDKRSSKRTTPESK